MLLSVLLPIFAVAIAVFTVVFADLSPWLFIPFLIVDWVALILLFACILAVSSLFVKKGKKEKGQNRYFRWLLLNAYDLLIRFFRVRVTVTGMEKLPPVGETFLLVSNHLSNFDHMIILAKLNRYPMAFVSKPENFTIPIAGRLLQKCYFLPIDRDNARNAIVTINAISNAMANGALSFGIFPEGTRSKTGALLPFHDGVFFAAHHAKVPVVVVHMHDTRAVMKRGPWQHTDVRMDILEVLDAQFVAKHRDGAIAQAVRDAMEACAAQLGPEAGVDAPVESPTPETPAEESPTQTQETDDNENTKKEE